MGILVSIVVDDGVTLPLYPAYHDFDDRFLSRILDGMSENERLICQVRDTTCYGEDGIDIDPSFHWRVYTCKVTVYRQNLPEIAQKTSRVALVNVRIENVVPGK